MCIRDRVPTGDSLSGIAYLVGVTYANGQFLAVGYSYAPYSNTVASVTRASLIKPARWFPRLGTLLTSTDGINWVQRQAGTPYHLSSVAYGNGRFVAVGGEDLNLDVSETRIVTSSDGMNWDVHQPGTYALATSIAYGNGQFVAVGGSDPYGFIMTSVDGMDWVLRLSPSTKRIQPLASIAYGDNRFVAVGGGLPPAYSSNVIATSIDGVNWEFIKSVVNLKSVAYGNGQFVAVGSSGIILTSADGAHWIRRPTTTTAQLNGINFGSGQFAAVGYGGTIVTSADGTTWVKRPSGTGTWLWGVGFGNGRFLAIGDRGTILESGSIINLAIRTTASTGQLTLSLEGPTELGYTIQTSTDLSSWRNLTNISSGQPASVVLDRPAAAADHLFYRAHSQ